MPSSSQPSTASATIQLPLQLTLSVSIGSPVAPGDVSVTGVTATTPLARQFAAGEGLFSAPPAAFNEFVRRFSPASLGATDFDWPAALSLALASRLAYDNTAGVQNVAKGAWALQTCDFIEFDDTQCFLVSTPTAVLISFRGTESLGDWLGNLNMIHTTRPYGTVHRGFLGAFQVVDRRLRNRLAELPGRALMLTGHSLGGALATIAAAEWQGTFNITGVYTYGQPAVGKADFRAVIDQHYASKFFRFVNDDDIVPRVPPTYRHVGRLFHFDAAGGLKSRVESMLATGSPGTLESPAGPPLLSEQEFDRVRIQLLQQRMQVRAAGIESVPAPAIEGLLPSVSDHSIEHYIAKIAKVKK